MGQRRAIDCVQPFVAILFVLYVVALYAMDGLAGDPYFPPPDSAGGWREAKDAQGALSAANVDIAKLDRALEVGQASCKNGGLLVLRDGWLVYERYFGLGHREAAPNLASCGKSFTSIAVGILMADRPDKFPRGLDEKIFTPSHFPPETFPLKDERMKDISLGQLLSFSAGVRGNNPGFVNGKEVLLDPTGPDGASAMRDEVALGNRDLSRPDGSRQTTSSLWCEPGGGYSYATSSIHLASIMIRHITGKEMQELIGERLAGPLGWGRWGFAYQSSKLGHTPGGGGIALRATDMLRFGHLLLNQGRWGNSQLVPAEYVRHCSQQSPYNPHFPYSLQFNVNTRGEESSLPRDAYWKGGSGGHVLYVVPSLNLVVWKLGGRDSQYSYSDTGIEIHPSAPKDNNSRAGWRETISSDRATVETLRLVIESMRQP